MAQQQTSPDGSYTHASIAEMIAGEFPNYERWVAEGKPPYASSYRFPPMKPQHYHDHYHCSITDLFAERLGALGKCDLGDNSLRYWCNDIHTTINEYGIYAFRFQVFDSPEGDTWIKGNFRRRKVIDDTTRLARDMPKRLRIKTHYMIEVLDWKLVGG